MLKYREINENIRPLLYIMGMKLSKLLGNPANVHLWGTDVGKEPFERVILMCRKGKDELSIS